MQNAYVLRESAVNFLEHLKDNPDVKERLDLIMYFMEQAQVPYLESIQSGYGRIALLAVSNAQASTFDGFAQGLHNAVQQFVDEKDGDILGDDLRHALTDILGLPEIPKRGAPREEIEAFIEKTGGAGGGEHYMGALLPDDASLN